MIPQQIDPDGAWSFEEVCELGNKWGLDQTLATRIVTMAREFSKGSPVTGLSIISGLRTDEEQNALRRAGRPTADNDKSTHLACPATGADLRVNGVSSVDRSVRQAFGVAARFSGLRWGGGSRVDPDTGIPSDWNHVDLGPRAQVTP